MVWEIPIITPDGSPAVANRIASGPKYLNRCAVQWPAHGNHGWTGNHMGNRVLVEIPNGVDCPTCKDMADWLASQLNAEEV